MACSGCRWPSSRCRCTCCCPHHYAREFGLPLATLGALLLAARLADALVDPLLGRWIDRRFRRSARSVQGLGLLAALLLALGLTGLFLPPVRGANALLAWAGASLILSYTGYSLLAIAHQAWARGSAATRSSAVASWPGARALACSGCCWPPSCRPGRA